MLFLVTTSLLRLLPSLEVVAVSQAAPPESNPNSLLPCHCHGGPISHHRKLTGQKLERLVAKGDQQFIMNHQKQNKLEGLESIMNTTLHESGLRACSGSRKTKGVDIMNAIK